MSQPRRATRHCSTPASGCGKETDYPWQGNISLTLKPETVAAFTLALRIPGWCHGARLTINGKAVRLASITRKGYARIRREWNEGDRVKLVLPMPPERIEAHPSARQDCGRIALQRGAIPYFLWANREPGEMLVWIREG